MTIGRGTTHEGLLPEGESLRNAVRWLSARLAAGQPASLKLIEEAALRFDLSPIEEKFLLQGWLHGAQRSEQEGAP